MRLRGMRWPVTLLKGVQLDNSKAFYPSFKMPLHRSVLHLKCWWPKFWNIDIHSWNGPQAITELMTMVSNWSLILLGTLGASAELWGPQKQWREWSFPSPRRGKGAGLSEHQLASCVGWGWLPGAFTLALRVCLSGWVSPTPETKPWGKSASGVPSKPTSAVEVSVETAVQQASATGMSTRLSLQFCFYDIFTWSECVGGWLPVHWPGPHSSWHPLASSPPSPPPPWHANPRGCGSALLAYNKTNGK